MSEAREEILRRVREAVSTPSPSVARSRDFRLKGMRSAEEKIRLFLERVAEYKAGSHRVTASDAPELFDRICSERGVGRLVVPQGLKWKPARTPCEPDRPHTHLELDAIAGVLTDCYCAIADTGTLILDGGPGQGRRVLTLLPDFHLCVVEAERIVELVPEAVERMASSPGRPFTMISGPSATSDIELSRVEGVHGPRRLEVVVVG